MEQPTRICIRYNGRLSFHAVCLNENGHELYLITLSGTEEKLVNFDFDDFITFAKNAAEDVRKGIGFEGITNAWKQYFIDVYNCLDFDWIEKNRDNIKFENDTFDSLETMKYKTIPGYRKKRNPRYRSSAERWNNFIGKNGEILDD